MAISADIGPILEKFVETLIENGRYGSKSEVIREGLRLVQDREARLAALHAEIQIGIDAANAGELHDPDDVRAELRDLIASKTKVSA